MKIDLSTIFLVIFLVLPGLFSRRSQNTVLPRSLEAPGATEELAEFVVQGVAVHMILVFCAASISVLLGLVLHRQGSHYLAALNRLDLQAWARLHAWQAILLAAGYVLLSFIIAYFFGLLCGVWRLNRPVFSFLLQRVTWLQRWGVTGSLGEQPIVYQLLSPRLMPDGASTIVFVEAELKNGLGFYSGQVRQYAVVKDSEAHKLVYIVEAWFRLRRSDEYIKVDSEGVMIDLAEVATLKVDQIAESSLTIEEPEGNADSPLLSPSGDLAP